MKPLVQDIVVWIEDIKLKKKMVLDERITANSTVVQ
jgi:hypothetical protein